MTGDSWCHFSARLHRMHVQRNAKAWATPVKDFEKEKFSYVVLKRGVRPQIVRAVTRDWVF